MIKKILITACLFLSFISFAQEGTASPYSFYGIGEVRFKGAVENRSMAGISILSDSIHINLQNPAGYSDLKLTAFSIGGSAITEKLKTDSQTEKARRATLDYLAVGIPIGKLGIGFGLIPYSSVGYRIKNIYEDNSQNNNKLLTGTGGLNKVFLGFGYKIAPNLSVGADVQYNFGNIETTSLEFVTNVPVGTRELNTTNLSGVNFDIGAMYQAKIYKKLNLYTSLNFIPENTLKSKNTLALATVTYDSNYNLTVVDALDTETNTVDLKFPNKLSFGAGIGENKKWLVGAEVTMQNTANLYNSYNLNNVSFEKYSKYAIGGFFIPNYQSFTSYAKRVVYRGGLKYEKTGLVISSQSIKDVGLTLGIGLPLRGTFSKINIGFELGKKGTTASNLVQENYANLSVGLSLSDKWFEKRKYN